MDEKHDLIQMVERQLGTYVRLKGIFGRISEIGGKGENERHRMRIESSRGIADPKDELENV